MSSPGPSPNRLTRNIVVLWGLVVLCVVTAVLLPVLITSGSTSTPDQIRTYIHQITQAKDRTRQDGAVAVLQTRRTRTAPWTTTVGVVKGSDAEIWLLPPGPHLSSPMPAFARVKATKPLVIGVGCSYYKLQSDGTYWEAPDVSFGLQPQIVLAGTTSATIKGFTATVTSSGTTTQYVLTGDTATNDYYHHVVGRTTVHTGYVGDLTITYSTTPKQPRTLYSHSVFGKYGHVSVQAPPPQEVSKVTASPKNVPPSCRAK